MALVLAASAFYLYLRLGSHLATSLDRDLRVRAQDLAALVAQPHVALAKDNTGRFIERGESYAQVLTPGGRVLDATRPLGRGSLLSPAELCRATREPVFVDKSSIPGLNEGSRLLATRVSRGGRPAVLVAGATRQNDVETLANFRDELLIAGPIALLLACGVGYLLAGLSLRQVESMRQRAAAISGEEPGERLPVPSTDDEVQRLGETLNEMLDRLESALERERDLLGDAGHELRTPLRCYAPNSSSRCATLRRPTSSGTPCAGLPPRRTASRSSRRTYSSSRAPTGVGSRSASSRLRWRRCSPRSKLASSGGRASSGRL